MMSSRAHCQSTVRGEMNEVVKNCNCPCPQRVRPVSSRKKGSSALQLGSCLWTSLFSALSQLNQRNVRLVIILVVLLRMLNVISIPVLNAVSTAFSHPNLHMARLVVTLVALSKMLSLRDGINLCRKPSPVVPSLPRRPRGHVLQGGRRVVGDVMLYWW